MTATKMKVFILSPMQLSLALACLLVAQLSTAQEEASSCGITHQSLVAHHAVFHADSVCNREEYTNFKNSLRRRDKYQFFKQEGYATVPNQETRICPRVVTNQGVNVNSVSTTAETSVKNAIGYDTTWFLKNDASTAVVVALVHPDSGAEVSALNEKIAPPQADSNAIVQPGDTKVIHTFEGYAFVVRSVYPDGSTGDVLLQHRAGLIPIGAHAQQLACPSTDPEPLIEVTTQTAPTKAPEVTVVLDPEFERRPVQQFKECNMVELGFRNLANCPIHGYYVQPGTCKESFRFHLGTNDRPPYDFQYDWTSSTKFEASFVGHSFVFRSAFSAQEVARITIEPVVVTDCPDLKEQVYESSRQLDILERVWGLEGVNNTKMDLADFDAIPVYDYLLGKENISATAVLYATPGSMYSV